MGTYEILNVDESNKGKFCLCLEEWSDEMREAGPRKSCWLDFMKDKGLGAKMVRGEDGVISGMIQYIPAEYAPLTGENFYYIYCIWVHAHKKGIGDKRGKGLGTALLKAAEEDIKSRGADGVAAWGITMPFWMKASWYRKHGYRVIQKDGMRRLLWKPFSETAVPPQWYRKKKKPDLTDPKGKVTVTSVVNGICPVANLANERAKAVAEEFGDSVVFQEVVTEDPKILEEWGIGDTLFINKKEIVLGPPLSKKKIHSAIKGALKK